MKPSDPSRLFASANLVLFLGIVGALLAAQWKHEAVPLAVLAVILLLTVIKARLIILDFMELRGKKPDLATALWLWPLLFAVAAFARALGTPDRQSVG